MRSFRIVTQGALFIFRERCLCERPRFNCMANIPIAASGTPLKSFTSVYRSTIASHVTRAAVVAGQRGLSVEVAAPFMQLRRKRSWAALVFHLNHVVLDCIEVEPRDRRKRYGSAMLADVIAIADALGLRIDLIAESATLCAATPPAASDERSELGLVQSKLESWYRRHAFVEADDALMRRCPAHPPP